MSFDNAISIRLKTISYPHAPSDLVSTSVDNFAIYIGNYVRYFLASDAFDLHVTVFFGHTEMHIARDVIENVITTTFEREFRLNQVRWFVNEHEPRNDDHKLCYIFYKPTCSMETVDELRQEIKALSEKIDKVYNAPGMPGMIDAWGHFTKTRNE